MAIRLPYGLTSLAAGEAAQGALEAELLNEKVESLGLAGRKAQASLAALAAFEADGSDPARQALVDAAARDVWSFMVQRELCGFAPVAGIMDDLSVPAEVRARLGARSAAAPQPDKAS